METKGKCTNKSNVIKWSILVSILVVAIIGSGIGVVIANHLKKSALTSASGEENIIESSSLENFEAVENKTEEELKELNEKEIKKSENKQKNNSSTKNSKNKYYIKVNYGAQVVTVYTYDSKGNYTVPVRAMVCSTGTETPRSGVYKTPVKMVWCHMFGDVWAHYCTQIVGNILFHSVPFLEKNNHTLEYWEYDKLGTKASMGCIRLTTRDAKWLFDNVPAGTSVEFYSSSNPGPLGKPSAPKISSAPSYLRGWDPTDPDPNNPWIKYNSQSENTSKNEANTQNPSVNNTENNQSSGSSSNVENNQGSINDTNTENNQSGGNTSQGGNIENNETTGGNVQNNESSSGNNPNSGSTTGGSGSTNSEVTGGNSQNNETAGGNTNNEAVDGNDTNTENNQNSEENKNNENNQSDGDNTQGENV